MHLRTLIACLLLLAPASLLAQVQGLAFSPPEPTDGDLVTLVSCYGAGAYVETIEVARTGEYGPGPGSAASRAIRRSGAGPAPAAGPVQPALIDLGPRPWLGVIVAAETQTAAGTAASEAAVRRSPVDREPGPDRREGVCGHDHAEGDVQAAPPAEHAASSAQNRMVTLAPTTPRNRLLKIARCSAPGFSTASSRRFQVDRQCPRAPLT